MTTPSRNQAVLATHVTAEDIVLAQANSLRTLSNSLLFAQSAVQNIEMQEMLRKEAAACISFIEAGGPIANPAKSDSTGSQVTRLFLDSSNWGHSIEVRDLFSAFVKAGQIMVDEPLKVPDFSTTSLYKHGSLPLEAAIIIGNHSAFDALLENHADILKVPSKVYSKFSGAGKPLVNIFSFIELHRSNEEDGIIFASKIKEFIMRRQLKLSAPVLGTSDSPAAPGERRRKVGV